MSWSRVSVVLITRNAEDVLPGALASIPPAAEVIVADGDSTDRTVALAQRHGARVVQQNRDAIAAAAGNFDVARNDAAQSSRRDWLLFLDSDERITPALSTEIAATLERPTHDVYDMPRRNLFWGQPVRLLGDDRQLRLVRNGCGHFRGHALHSRMQVDGSVGHLAGHLIHENVKRWRDVTRRFRQYVPIEGRCRPAPTIAELWRTPARMFRYYYLGNGAWRDGVRGLAVCLIYAAYHGAVLWTARRDGSA